MSSQQVHLIFEFTIKPGNENKYQETLARQLEFTERRDPYVLHYEIYKNDDGSYCQHEHYENEEAIVKHMQTTEEELKVWNDITEITSMYVLGSLSDAFVRQYGHPKMRFFPLYKEITR